jgi:hypothetical protein
MKKMHLVLFAIFMLSIALVLVISPSVAISQQKTARSAYSVPDDVAKILHNSCTGCHDLGGSKMASSVWSFSAWDNYPAAKQAKKSEAICKAMTKGSMPPPSERNAHPEKNPTKVQIETVCKWAGSFRKK